MDQRGDSRRSQRGARRTSLRVGQQSRQMGGPRKSLSDQLSDGISRFFDDFYKSMQSLMLWGCAIALGLFLLGVVASVVVLAVLHWSGADTGAVITVGKFIGLAGAIVIALSVIYRLVVLFTTGLSKLRFGASDVLAVLGIVVGIAGIIIGHYWK